MPTIVTVKPAGGGDFTDLQDAVDFIAAKTTPDWWIEIHSDPSGAASVGDATLDYSAWSSVPDATHYPKIYAAADNAHNGTTFASPRPATVDRVTNSVPYLHVQGLVFDPVDTTAPLLVNTASGVQITGNFFRGNSMYPGGILLDATGGDVTGVVIANNFLGGFNLGDTGSDSAFGIELRRGNDVDVAIVNNTIVGSSSAMHAPIGVTGTGTPAVSVLVRNNILCCDGTGGNPIDDPDSAATASADHNISNGSALGTFSLGSQTTADVVLNILWDLRINSSSPAYNAGALDSANAPTDAFGTTRPIGAAADCGAFELDVTSPPAQNGLLARYYASYSYVDSSTPFPNTSPSLSLVEGMVDHPNGHWFDGGADVDGLSGDPPSPVGNTNFAAVWTGHVIADFSENYTFTTTSDDGVRLYINGTLVIDDWNIHGDTGNDSSPIAMTAGTPVPIRLEYFQSTGGFNCNLLWSSPSAPSTVVIPTQNLLADSLGLSEFASRESGVATVLNSFGASDAGTFRVGYGSFGSQEIGVAGVLQNFGSSESGIATITHTFGDQLTGVARVGYISFGSAEPGTAYILNPFGAEDSGIARVGYSSFASQEVGTFTLYGAFGDELQGDAMIYAGFGDRLSGLHRVANDSLARFELYHGVGASPDFSSPPESTFTSLPFRTSMLSTNATHRFVLRRRNAWNLSSQNTSEWVIKVASDGTAPATPPSDPTDIAARAAAGGTVAVTARYLYTADGADAADSFLIYLAVNATPVIGVTVPIVVEMVKADGVAKLNYATAAQSEGAVVNVIVRTRRSGSPDVDSVGTTVYSATATLLGPAVVEEAEIYQGAFAEQIQS